MAVRVLMGPSRENGEPASDQISEQRLLDLYAAPADPWLRVNMVSTLDGAAQGADGRSGTINNAADKRVFDALRSLADCLLVGAGTVRAEGYRPEDLPLVVVSRSGQVPPSLRGAPAGSVLMATTEHAPRLGDARDQLGEDNVLVLGGHRVDLAALKARLAKRDWTQILSEGGPHLLRDLVAAGVVNELCLTTVPRVIAGDGIRIARGSLIDARLEPHLLLEDDGTLLGRWFITSD